MSGQICIHRGCNSPIRKNGPFCANHQCKYAGCRRHVVGNEKFTNQYNILFSQFVPYCGKHRCNYYYGMSGKGQCNKSIKHDH